MYLFSTAGAAIQWEQDICSRPKGSPDQCRTSLQEVAPGDGGLTGYDLIVTNLLTAM
jgi:hypothetical protein